jgi:hypothetical protein
MAVKVVAETVGCTPGEAAELIAGRPWHGDDAAIPKSLRSLVLGLHPGAARAAAI